jgi:hypothetical protein
MPEERKEIITHVASKCINEIDDCSFILNEEEIKEILFSVVTYILTMYSMDAEDLMRKVETFCDEQKYKSKKMLQKKNNGMHELFNIK